MQRNKILCFFATIIIAAVTIYAVFRGGGVSFGQLAESIKEASVPGIILSCISMFGFIFFEGEALREIVFHMGYPTKHKDAFVYSAADIYFSAITPSASGGQPASAFFMIKDGMPATTVMAALLVNLIMYTLAVISIGVFAILAFPKIFLNFSVVCKIFIVSGIIVLSVLAIIFYLLLRKQEILKKLAVWLEAFLRKIHCVYAADRVQNKMEAALKDYANCVELIFHKKRVLWKAFLLNLLQRMSQIMVTLFTFFAIHGDLSKIWELFATQIYVVLGSNCVPIPGAIGVADYLMLSGYKELMSKSDAYHLEILSRGLSFYGCMMISMITVLVGYICLRKKEIRRDK